MEDSTTHQENSKHESDWHQTLIEQVNDLITLGSARLCTTFRAVGMAEEMVYVFH